MKKRKKVKFNTILQLAVGAVLGAGIGYALITAMSNKKPAGYGTLLLLSFIIIYYFSVIIHELTHFISFKVHGTEMRLLVMGPFVFIKANNKWKFKFKFIEVFALGGIAMPNIDVIDSDEKFERYRRSFAKVLIAAPLSNVVLNIIVVATSVVCYKYVQSELWKSYIVFVAEITTIISLFLNLSSFIKNDLAVGDYRAYSEVLKDRDFSYVCFYQYLMISDKYTIEDKKYLTENILAYLEKSLNDKSFNNYVIAAVDNMVNDYLSGKIKEIPEIAKGYIEFASENCEELLKVYPNPENPLILLHHIVLYYSMEESSKQKAIGLYNKIISMISHNTKVLKYYDLRSRYVLGFEGNLEFISNKKNIKTSSLYELFSLFDWYYNDEMKILERFRVINETETHYILE